MDIPTVPLRTRRDGWTVPRQRIFVRALAEGESVGAAARRVGMSKASAYKLRQRPQAAALDRAINGVVDVRDKDGVRKTRHRPCSARLMIALLKRAEKAKARANPELAGPGVTAKNR